MNICTSVRLTSLYLCAGTGPEIQKSPTADLLRLKKHAIFFLVVSYDTKAGSGKGSDLAKILEQTLLPYYSNLPSLSLGPLPP